MRFAKIAFRVAGVWGILVLIPLYFLFDQPPAVYRPTLSYPFTYYGFLGVAMAWQVAFLIIASDPVRYRPLMIAAMLEKFGHVATGAVLYAQAQIAAPEFRTVVPDLVLGALFVIAYRRTSTAG
jgi:hypothetical protein